MERRNGEVRNGKDIQRKSKREGEGVGGNEGEGREKQGRREGRGE